MKVEIKTIWPNEAKEILETKNLNNRNISNIFVKKLANDILNNAFLVTHQGIAFDSNGLLIDGQHRLAACVMANKPITLLVTSDIPAVQNIGNGNINTFEILDSGKNRTVSQMLALSGMKYANRVAAAVKAAALLCCKTSTNFGVSVAQTHKILNMISDSIYACIEVGIAPGLLKPVSWILGPMVIYHYTFPDKAIQLLTEFTNVTQPHNSNAASRALAKFYSKNFGISGGQQQVAFYNYVCFAIHKFHFSEPVTRMASSDLSRDWLLSLNPDICRKIAQVINPKYK